MKIYFWVDAIDIQYGFKISGVDGVKRPNIVKFILTIGACAHAYICMHAYTCIMQINKYFVS